MRLLSAGVVMSLGILGGDGPAHAAPAGACSLATSAQITAALGAAVDAGKQLGTNSCQWREKAKTGAAAFIVDLSMNTPIFFRTIKEMHSTAIHKPVPGLGDDAFFALWKTANQVNESLWVKRSNSAFNVRIWGSRAISDVDREAKERAIASIPLKHI